MTTTDIIHIKGIVVEDFVNYKYPSMFISIGGCDFKCCIEGHFDKSVCQNSILAKTPETEHLISTLYDLYITNSISKAIVFGGMEPFTRFFEVLSMVRYFREHNCHDVFVIYTGYYPHELQDELSQLKKYDNIIVKFGRYIPNNTPHMDEILGIELVSDNQYAEVIS